MKSLRMAGVLALLALAPRVHAVTRSTAAPAQFRGMWVTAWAHGFKTPVEIDHLIQAATTAHLNALLVEVRKRGDAYYMSSTEPHASDIAPDFDPLAMLIERAHAAGIQVHAWMVMFPAWSGANPPPPGHVLERHPDWATVHVDGHRMAYVRRDTDEGIFLDPGVPGVQDYLVGTIRELVARYPVDGVNLDYIRYPGRQWGYHPIAVARFAAETGHTPSTAPGAWDRWRREQVTTVVARIARVIAEVRPSVRLSAAVFPDRHSSYVVRLQDWESWMRRGLVDFVAPMNYATSRAMFASRNAQLLGRNRIRPVYMGVGGGNKSEGALLHQMRLLAARRAPGIILYAYDGNSPQFWQRLGSRLFNRPALVPSLPWKPMPSS